MGASGVSGGMCCRVAPISCSPEANWEIGGARRDRTADLYNAIVALSQLSYGPIREARMLGQAAANGNIPIFFYA